MSNRSPRIPSYRRHATGQAFVQIRGERIYLGKYGSDESKERYNRIVAELCRPSKSPQLADKSPEERARGITVVEVIQIYLEFAKQYYAKNGRSTRTAENMRPVMSRLRETYGRTLAAEFGPLRLKAIRQQMIDEKLSRKYVNDNVDRIRRMFRWATP